MPTPPDVKSPNGLPQPVIRQIQASAKYHGPGVYAGMGSEGGLSGLLTFYRDLTLTADPAAAGFIPISPVSSRGRNTKLFAIGILPPSMTIDQSQLLDRSAVVPNLTGDAQLAGSLETIAGADADELRRPRQISRSGIEAIKSFEGFSLKAYPDVDKWAIGYGHNGKEVVKGLVWTREQADAQFALDLQKFERAVSTAITVPVTQGQYDAMVSLAYNIGASAFANSTLVRKLNANDTAGAGREILRWNKVKGKVAPVLVSRRTVEFKAFERSPLEPAEPIPVQADVDSAEFVGFGSENGNSFRRGVARQTDLLQLKLLFTQATHLHAIKSALQAMYDTPPLRMLINPSSFSVKSQKIVNDGNWGRSGPIIEFWGDDQDKISGSGQVAAFYAIDAFPQLGGGGPGLTRSARNVSMGWQNFQSLYLLYRSNGGMYLQGMAAQDKNVLLTTVGSVYLFYDNILYIGSFDSFNVSEADTKPFSVEYQFEFTVRAAFLLEPPPDFDYGGAAAFKSGRAGGLSTGSGSSRTPGINDIAAHGSSVVPSETVQAAVSSASDVLVGSVVSAAEFIGSGVFDGS